MRQLAAVVNNTEHGLGKDSATRQSCCAWDRDTFLARIWDGSVVHAGTWGLGAATNEKKY